MVRRYSALCMIAVAVLGLCETSLASAKDEPPSAPATANAPSAPSSVGLTDKQKKAARSMVGRFAGSCQSGDGVTIPTETELLPDVGDGTLKGKYVMHIEGKEEAGSLSAVSVDKNGRDVVFHWDDAYGYGNLTVTFNRDYSSFDGKWTGLFDKITRKTTEPKSGGRPWSGVRQKGQKGAGSTRSAEGKGSEPVSADRRSQ